MRGLLLDPESSAENFKEEVKAMGLIKDAKIYTNADKGYSV